MSTTLSWNLTTMLWTLATIEPIFAIQSVSYAHLDFRLLLFFALSLRRVLRICLWCFESARATQGRKKPDSLRVATRKKESRLWSCFEHAVSVFFDLTAITRLCYNALAFGCFPLTPPPVKLDVHRNNEMLSTCIYIMSLKYFPERQNTTVIRHGNILSRKQLFIIVYYAIR